MFAIAYDLTVAHAQQHQSTGVSAGFPGDHAREVWLQTDAEERIPSKDEDLASLFSAITELRGLDWFGRSVMNIRAFRVERGADFTAIVKGRH